MIKPIQNRTLGSTFKNLKRRTTGRRTPCGWQSLQRPVRQRRPVRSTCSSHRGVDWPPWLQPGPRASIFTLETQLTPHPTERPVIGGAAPANTWHRISYPAQRPPPPKKTTTQTMQLCNWDKNEDTL
uniref:Uncharacterized protein n=1 Tax=Myotis myotis TaxID=51298 RepID=A0A7J7V3F9_MYOMY|nr:hypothetical protein mMyoMyo1_008410 [Myotis myotis]